MAQKHLPILNRVGLFQHWSGAWDGRKTYPVLHRQQLLLKRIITEFIEHRNSVHIHLFDNTTCWEQLAYVEKLPKVRSFKNLIETIRAHRKKRARYLYVGHIIFLRFQTWAVFAAFLYKPEVKVKRQRLRRKFKATPLVYAKTQTFSAYKRPYQHIL